MPREPLPDLPPDLVRTHLTTLMDDPGLQFASGGPERWFIAVGDRRLRLRAAVALLCGVERFRSSDARAWLRERGIGFEREHRPTGDGLPDLHLEEIAAAWDADLAKGATGTIRNGPQDWEWGVRHRGEVLPLKRAAAAAANATSGGHNTIALQRWLARRGVEIVPPATEPARWWIFQGNPSIYDLRGALGTLDRLTWRVQQHKGDIRAQDRVLFWESGAEGGVVGVGTVLCAPLPDLEFEDDAPFLRQAAALPASNQEVWVRVDTAVEPPLGRAELAMDPILATLRTLQPAPLGTNFPMTQQQAAVLLARLDLPGLPAASAVSLAPVDPRTHDILKTLTRIPVARGQVLFFRLLRDHPEGVAARDVQSHVFTEDPRQGSGLLAALARRINGTDLATGPSPGIGLLAKSDAAGRWVARPELWSAIERLPPLAEAIRLPWEEMLTDISYVTCTMPAGLEVARAAAPLPQVEPPWQALRRHVAEKLVLSDELLSAFLLALQAKRFVIFSGISGTGKTRVAQAVAQWAAGPTGGGSTAGPAEAGVEIEVQPYLFDYRRFTLPAAVVRRARLPVSTAGWSSEEVAVAWPEGTAKLRVGSEAARPGVRTLFLKGDVLAWLQRTVQVGDRLLLDVVSGPDDGWDGLRIALPRKGASRPARSYEIIPVRPDWKDTRPLLGFYNPITESYQRTPFLDLVLTARTEAQRADKEGREPAPFFAILDEMNLAHVEQYFADVLSAMESDEEIPLHGDARVDQGLADGTDQVPCRIRLPRNLFIVGTVNVDETTHAFSPKVLDRAFVIELSEVWLDGDPPAGPLALPRLPEQLSLLGRLDRASWDRLETTAGPDARRTLLALQSTLAHEGRPIGYRPLFEMARFLQLAFEQGGDAPGTLAAALDQAVLQKVLPKLNGRQHELEPVLRRLFDVAVSGGASLDDAPRHDPAAWRRRPDGRLARAEDGPVDEDLSAPTLPRCAAKLHRMLRDVRRQGFVSFIG